MNINWYPGHMKKTADSIKENLKKVNVVLELLDARAPIATRNPLIEKLIGDKKIIFLFNKTDLADEEKNREWLKYFKEKNFYPVEINANTGKGISRLVSEIEEVMRFEKEKDRERGIVSELIKVMVVGVPNVGKSSLINALAGRKSAKTGNVAGITKSNQWIKVENKILLLDMPGILWPKFETEELALNLCYIGSIKDEVLVVENICLEFIKKMQKENPEVLENRYKIAIEEEDSPLEIMEKIARKRGIIFKGAEVDYMRVSNLILDEFRKGKLGRITLESPFDKVEKCTK